MQLIIPSIEILNMNLELNWSFVSILIHFLIDNHLTQNCTTKRYFRSEGLPGLTSTIIFLIQIGAQLDVQRI